MALRCLLGELGLELKDDKTRIVRLEEGGEGLDFLGFHHRWVRSREARSRHVTFLARWPSRRAMGHARERIRDLTARERLRVPVEDTVRELDACLRGWVGYLRFGNSTKAFDKIKRHAISRLAVLVAKRHGRPVRWGWSIVVYRSPDLLGLFDPNGNRHRPQAALGLAAEAECRR